MRIDPGSAKGWATLLANSGSVCGKFLIRHAQSFTPAQLPPDIKLGPMRQCYMNAYQLASAYPRRYWYAEGYAAGIIPVEHAWVVDRNGNAYDPTWRWADCKEYFGVVFHHSYRLEVTLRSRYYGILFNANNDVSGLVRTRQVLKRIEER